jgi:hypothetical protein
VCHSVLLPAFQFHVVSTSFACLDKLPSLCTDSRFFHSYLLDKDPRSSIGDLQPQPASMFASLVSPTAHARGLNSPYFGQPPTAAPATGGVAGSAKSGAASSSSSLNGAASGRNAAAAAATASSSSAASSLSGSGSGSVGSANGIRRRVNPAAASSAITHRSSTVTSAVSSSVSSVTDALSLLAADPESVEASAHATGEPGLASSMPRHHAALSLPPHPHPPPPRSTTASKLAHSASIRMARASAVSDGIEQSANMVLSLSNRPNSNNAPNSSGFAAVGASPRSRFASPSPSSSSSSHLAALNPSFPPPGSASMLGMPPRPRLASAGGGAVGSSALHPHQQQHQQQSVRSLPALSSTPASSSSSSGLAVAPMIRSASSSLSSHRPLAAASSSDIVTGQFSGASANLRVLSSASASASASAAMRGSGSATFARALLPTTNRTAHAPLQQQQQQHQLLSSSSLQSMSAPPVALSSAPAIHGRFGAPGPSFASFASSSSAHSNAPSIGHTPASDSSVSRLRPPSARVEI